MNIDKRYQVFISSTYEDLKAERQEVMQALLELDCIPSGMEIFPAANEEQWEVIKQVISECDYYIVIIGGCYGSICPGGMSYTEREYRYAIDKGKPVIGFYHKDPGKIPVDKTEQTPDGKEKLKKFLDLVKSKLCKPWSTPEDLGGVVSRSLVNLIRTNPAIGWVRADNLPEENYAEEILKLKNTIDELQARLKQSESEPPKDADKFAQGDDLITLGYYIEVREEDSYNYETYSFKIKLTWNKLFAAISPKMIDEANEKAIKSTIDELIIKEARDDIKANVKDLDSARNFHMDNDKFDTILIQFKAIGLIEKSIRKRSIKDTSTYWTLTPYGENEMTKLRAIKRGK